MNNPVAINLVPRRIREDAAVRQRTHRWLGFGALYVVAVAAVCIALNSAGNQESSRLTSNNGMLADRVAAAQQQLETIRRQVYDHAYRKEASETVGVHPDWSVLLAALAEMREDDILLQSIDLRATEILPTAPAKKPSDTLTAPSDKPKIKPRAIECYTVDLKGYGLSQGDVVRFIRRLEERSPLSEVRLRESRAQPHRGVAAVAFTAQFKLIEAERTPTAPDRAAVESNP